MLTWLDGRNNSSFTNISWSGNVLNFKVTAASGSNNLRGMLPFNSGSVALAQLTLYVTGNPAPIQTFNTTTDNNGQFVITGVPTGTYNVRVKGSHTLARILTNQAIVLGGNTLSFWYTAGGRYK
ncbi:MAG: carboxypeptidase-like regulatory domain-containing protein [Bacteroidota bacterium]